MAEHGDQAKPLAGGQSLVPPLAMRRVRPSHVVDLHRVAELQRISVAAGRVRIGAMARQRDLEHDPAYRAWSGPRSRISGISRSGTVEPWAACAMDPAAEWPAVALALDAVMVAASVRGRREIAADDFLLGPQTTALEPDELLVEVVVPVGDEGFGFAEVTRRGGRFRAGRSGLSGQRGRRLWHRPQGPAADGGGGVAERRRWDPCRGLGVGGHRDPGDRRPAHLLPEPARGRGGAGGRGRGGVADPGGLA